jgi:phage gpG-like protein
MSTREQIHRAIQRLPAAVAGRGGRSVADAIFGRMAQVLLSDTMIRYGDLARGGQDANGDKWAPLARSTVRQRRRSSDDKKTIRNRTGGLSKEQQDELRGIWKRTKARMLADGHGTNAAEGFAHAAVTRHARKQGWDVRSVTELMESREHEILVDTGRLQNSFSTIVIPGGFAVGTNVEYAKYHQSELPRKMKADGTPRLPRRPVVYDPDKIPAETWDAMLRAMLNGLAEAARQIGGGRG